tara:strand:- start:140 stop:1225 length:1086 start_codon:yes stop_codon:yes gene_type:complete
MKKLTFYFFLILGLIFVSFFALEVTLRIYLSLKHFNNPYAYYWGKTWYRFETPKINKFDENLISDLTKVKFENVDIARWKKNSNITINEKRFRENDNNLSNFVNKKKILVTGDSFTFGSQVSNNETWPSYLERKSKILVFNGGHPGYSTGQSLRKAIILSKDIEFNYFIWSIIYEDFNRDFNTKFIIKENGNLRFNEFKKNKNFKEKEKQKLFYHYLKEIFFVFYLSDRELFSKILKKKKQPKYYEALINGTTDYSEEELINFLINEFLKIKIENKYILIQYTDQSKNTGQKIRDARREQIENKYSKILFDAAYKNGIKILDTKIAFEEMSEDKKRLLWFDHHTDKGNEVVANFILKEINF